MPDEPKPEEQKIVVYEDWKSQVEAEREQAQQGKEPAEKPAESAEQPAEQMPPPNLTFLTSSLYLQGTIALGMLPGPTSDKPEVDLLHARHVIDLLGMLREKTEGNRTEDESKEIDAMLHELRMSFLSLQQKQAAPDTV